MIGSHCALIPPEKMDLLPIQGVIFQIPGKPQVERQGSAPARKSQFEWALALLRCSSGSEKNSGRFAVEFFRSVENSDI